MYLVGGRALVQLRTNTGRSAGRGLMWVFHEILCARIQYLIFKFQRGGMCAMSGPEQEHPTAPVRSLMKFKNRTREQNRQERFFISLGLIWPVSCFPIPFIFSYRNSYSTPRDSTLEYKQV